ncbi:HlyD family efflux transporter periplasmic adaptor subunit [Massilia arenosa]|uniref:HlyD family efflux transporter periplasmic adaptor subunit n=1 Tax=Zemynaea arenosa TaxID=2561931 RepID=A0A4Y9SAA6_9BURK|nr:HlyD family efflux transporter periplasmic adaptor subunit [Massilia arenosa]TFW16506.1 HlyD family efflux transporter periplasmic adaptor subunit [Massilia arenosa]
MTTADKAATQDSKDNPRKRKLVLGAITALFIVAGLAYAVYYNAVLSHEEETDDAYVGGNMVTVTSQVTGNVAEIRADETQMVQAGAPLVRLDPVDAELALEQAQARLGNAVRQLRERYTGVAQYEAALRQRELTVKTAQDDLNRRLPLAADHTVSGEEVAHARRALDDAKAAQTVAAKQLDAARVGIAGVNVASHPAVQAARADVVQAWLAVRRNAIPAPVSGYVAKRSVQVGSRVTPGTSLMSIVPLDQLWVDANFKESELKNIRVGQPAEVVADIYGSKVTYHGKVLGMSAGTGSAFSLLPAQNATGNWIKVVQRVPVRIALDPKELAQHPLRVGLSATVTVDTKSGGSTLGTAAPNAPVYTTTALNQPLKEAEAAADAIVARNMAH